MSKAKAAPEIPKAYQYSTVGKGNRVSHAMKNDELFVALPEQSGKIHPAFVKLSGAPAAWKKADKADWVYIPGMYLAGTPSNIRKVLRVWHEQAASRNARAFDKAMVDQLLAGELSGENGPINVYSAKNTVKGAELHDAFEAELARIKATRSKEASDRASLAPSSFAIQTYAALLGANKGKFFASEELAKNHVKSSGKAEKPVGKSWEERLVERIELAKENGKVVDVSKLGTSPRDTYIGSNTADKHNKNNFYYLEDMPYLDSKTFEGYELALKALGYSGAELKELKNRVKKAAANAGSEGGEEEFVLPTASRPGSQRASPRGGRRKPAEEEEEEEEESQKEESEEETVASPKMKSGKGATKAGRR